MALTAERLIEVVIYDPDTGVFIWRVHHGQRNRAGHRAGFNGGPGYRQCRIDGHLYFEHRLAFLYMCGAWPEHQVDHINCNKRDNSWSNLRPATASQNAANTRPKTKRKVGSSFKGVSWHSKTERWQAHIRVNGTSRYLGLFDNENAAHSAYCEASQNHFGEYARAI